jgi:hypothetical protein
MKNRAVSSSRVNNLSLAQYLVDKWAISGNGGIMARSETRRARHGACLRRRQRRREERRHSPAKIAIRASWQYQVKRSGVEEGVENVKSVNRRASKGDGAPRCARPLYLPHGVMALARQYRAHAHLAPWRILP